MTGRLDLSKAMRIAAGEVRAADPFEEVAAISHLQNRFEIASRKNTKVEGYTAWQLRDAAEDLLRKQAYEDAFVSRIEWMTDHLSGNTVPEAREQTNYLRTLAHWDKASKAQRLDVCRLFTGYMVDMVNDLFHFRSPLRVEVKATRQGPAYEYNAVTQNYHQSVLPVNPSYHPQNARHHILRINTHPRSTFDDAVKTLGAIYHWGLTMIQGEIAKQYLQEHARKIEPDEKSLDVEVDRQRMAAFFNSNLNLLVHTYGPEALLPHRFAREQTEKMTKDLAQIIENGKSFDPPPAQGFLGRILGL